MSAERGKPETAVPLFIGGAWIPGSAGTREVIDPATERPMGAVSLAGDAEIAAAIAAAEAAFGEWRAKPALERGAILIRAANLIRERIERIARLLTLEQGKILAESRGELTRAVETFLWNGEEAPRIEGAIVSGRTPGSTRRRVATPLGVVAAFAAWNFPAVLAARKLGAALAAGCTVVL
jgi:succinate-semialdehyde dehydrogenase/glutarate-semialdehyde dehydrogenase